MSAIRIVNKPNLSDIITDTYKFNDNIRLLRRMLSVCYKYKCQICSIDMKYYPDVRNIDHIIPRSLIAISEFWNLELLCSSCNREKGSQLLTDWKKRCRNAVKSIYVIPKESILSNLSTKESKMAATLIFLSKSSDMEIELKKLYKDDEMNQQWGSDAQPLINCLREIALLNDDSNINRDKLIKSIKKNKPNNDALLKYLMKLFKEKKIYSL